MSAGLKRLATLVPYAAVIVGIYCVHSAWIAAVSYHAGALAVAAVGGRAKAPKPSRRFSYWWYASSAVFAVGGVALYLLWLYVWHDSAQVVRRLACLGISRNNWPCFAVYFCCVNSIVEELLWREYLQRDSIRPVFEDFAFAGYHALVLLAFAGAPWAALVFVGCALASWLWRMLRTATGGLAIPILTHLVADISIVIAVHLRAFR